MLIHASTQERDGGARCTLSPWMGYLHCRSQCTGDGSHGGAEQVSGERFHSSRHQPEQRNTALSREQAVPGKGQVQLTSPQGARAKQRLNCETQSHNSASVVCWGSAATHCTLVSASGKVPIQPTEVAKIHFKDVSSAVVHRLEVLP